MSKIYIDLSRTNAQIKSSSKTNEWTTILPDGLRIPAGSQIRINNAAINYQGLSGQSIEITKDSTLSFSFCFYLSHKEFLVPTYDFFYNSMSSNNFYSSSGLNTIDLDCFEEVNYQYLMSPDFLQVINNDRLIEFKNGSYYGRTGQPLIACYVDENGIISPYLEQLEIKIEAGIYSINSLSSIINDTINGTRVYIGGGVYKSLEQIKQENIEYDYSSIQSKILKKVNAWEYSYTFNDTVYNTFSNLMLSNDNTNSFMYNQTVNNKCLIYVTNKDFIDIMNDCKNETRNTNLYDFCNAWRNSHYFASIQKRWNPTPQGERAKDAQNNYIFTSESVDFTINDVTYKQTDVDYCPLDYGYYIGTSDFLFNYDSDLNSFSFSFLHSPCRMSSYDRIGGVNDQAGKVVSWIKKDVTLIDKLKLLNNLTDSQIQIITNTLYSPVSRNGGIIIYNWDLDICKKYKTVNYYSEDKYKYLQYNDFFNNTDEAALFFENSLLNQLGFSYSQLNDTKYYDKIISFDLNSQLYGLTTNCEIDATTQTSVSSLYCPLISETSLDFVNPPSEGEPGIPYLIENQVKYYDLLNTNKNRYGLSVINYKNWKYIFYHQCQCFPILTNSNSIGANNLPQLSKIPYFIITSNMFNADDIINYNNMPILGIVNKSNLSNEDFIVGFNDMLHWTQQDIVLNKITVFILNNDLTEPKLGPNSSIMLEITPNITTKK